MTYIEKVFNEKIYGDGKQIDGGAYKCLIAHWNQVKIQIPKILSCVSLIFPHYTLHDESHSIEILNCIYRFLGEDRIKELSVTDLWMILCASYCHDVGMFVDGNEIEQYFGDEKSDFFVYIKDIDPTSKLYKYKECFKIEKGKLVYNNCSLNLDSYNAARFLLADFLRKKHAARSREILSDVSLGVDWDIKRLYDIILDECLAHGTSFSDVMEKPQFEKGIGDDVCHPRFVSCLLRLGDLLDFDSSRISRYLLKHLSTSLPEDSNLHIKKHASIRHINISTKKIEAIAECDDCETASEVNSWSQWIKDELNNQRNYWYEIVPEKFAQSLPMFRGIVICLKNGYGKIDDKYVPKFEIDMHCATKLLQGSNIYSGKSRCIEEVLQNSVDATLIRLFLENRKELEFDHKCDEILIRKKYDRFSKICKNSKYSIKVSIKKNEKNWDVSIVDNGVGMSADDLKYLLKVGTSKKNKEKMDIVNQMPEFAKPSGVFGIGFQSIFLLTDLVKVKTRRYDDGDLIKAELKSPLKDGFVIKKSEHGQYEKYGTEIQFTIENEKLPEINQISTRGESFEAFWDECDFTCNDVNELKITQFYQTIKQFAWNCRFPIFLNNKKLPQNELNGILYVDKSSQLYLDIRFLQRNDLEFQGDRTYPPKSVIKFRDVPLKKIGIFETIQFYPFCVNVLSKSAEDILCLNREYMLSDFEKILYPIAIKKITNYLEEQNLDNRNKIYTSMFAEYYGRSINDEWTKLILYKNKEKELSVKEIIDNDYTVIIRHGIGREVSELKNKEIIFYEMSAPEIQFLAYELRKNNYKIKFSSYNNLIEFTFSKKGKDFVNMEVWFLFLRNKSQRSLMPCFEYENLSVTDDALVLGSHDPMYVFPKIKYPQTACPWNVRNGKIEWDDSDNFYNWVYENREKKEISIETIKRLFKKMKDKFQEYVDNVNKQPMNGFKERMFE